MLFYVFQNFKLLNWKSLVQFDCKYAKDIIFKDVKNLPSKQICAIWQALLSFYFIFIYF